MSTLPGLVRRRPVTRAPVDFTPVRRERSALHLRRLPAWWREVALVVGIYIAYDTSRGLRGSGAAAADDHARAVLNAERFLHIDVERSLNAFVHHTPVLAVAAGYFYATLHFVVTPAVLIWLYRRQPAVYGPARNSLTVATLTGLMIFWLVPTTPPRLLTGAGFTDTMAGVSGWGWWGGEGSAPKGLGGLTNQLAAMPSLHVGWAVWCGYLIYRYARRRWVRLLGLAYPIATTLVVVATANHYLLDAVAGVADVAISAGLVWLAYAVVANRKKGSRVLSRAELTPARDRRPITQLTVLDDTPASGDTDDAGHRLRREALC